MMASGVVVALLALAPSAAQGHSASLPDGFPKVWRTVSGTVVDFVPFSQYRLIRSVFELRSDKGAEKAYLGITWREGQASTRTGATCGGLRYSGRHVVDTRTHTDAWFSTAAGDVRARLKVTRRLSVFEMNTHVGPPLCVETSGIWSGSGGVLLGYDGTFVFTHDETLVFR